MNRLLGIMVAMALAVGTVQGASPGSARDSVWILLERARHLNQVDSVTAEAASRAALVDVERVYGPESLEAAEVLDELAVALRRGTKTDDPEALEVCERALRIKKAVLGDKDPRYATSLHNLGLLRMARTEYARALAELSEAFDIRQTTLGGNDPAVAKSLLALGSIKHNMGSFEEGLALTERAVAIEELALGKTNPERARGLDALAAAHFSLGDVSGSIALFDEAISLAERSPSPNLKQLATSYSNLAIAYDGIGDHPHAIQSFERALRMRQDLQGKNHRLVAVTLTDLGSVRQDIGDLARAKRCFEGAIRILEAKGSHDSADSYLGWARMKLGWLYVQEGKMARAGDSFHRALLEQENALGSRHPYLAHCLRGLAIVAKAQGRNEEAGKDYQRAVELLRGAFGSVHPDLGRALAEYASFQIATGGSPSAIVTALEAVRVNREQVRLTIQAIAESQAMLYVSDLDTGMDVALAGLAGTGSRPEGLVRSVWDALIRSRKLVLDEMSDRARVVGLDSGVRDLAQRLGAARSRLASLMVRQSAGEDVDQNRALIDRARHEVEEGERALAARSAAFRRQSDRNASGFDEVVSALPSGAALVSIARYGTKHGSYLAFVTGADRRPRVLVLGPSDGIDRLIARWRDTAGRPPGTGARALARSERDCRAAGEALRARIWDPLAPFLEGCRMVFVVPDGSFHLLNLAALPTASGGYLVETAHVIHYLSAERDIVTKRNPPPRGVGLLAVGGVSFDQAESTRATGPLAPRADAVLRSGSGLPSGPPDCASLRSVRFRPLPETMGEIEEITRIWGHPEEVVTLTGACAGERSVKELLPGRRVGHFATHGFFLDQACVGREDARVRGIGGITVIQRPHSAPRALANPFRLSGLALAGANQRDKAGLDDEDGILTAEEVTSLDLSALEWVVLSACDTGVGTIQSGEGVLGLRRAFETAGVGTLIMSLWAVDDRSTREWMTALYQGRFQKNLETAEAVRAADLTVLSSLRKQGRSTLPFYWASFVAAGGWR